MHLSTRAINLTADTIYHTLTLTLCLCLALWALLRPILIIALAALCLIAPLALCELGSRYLIHLTH